MKTVNARKYLKFLEESKSKIVLIRKLSLGTNIQEDTILDEFSEFDPLIRMIDGTNFKKFIPNLHEVITLANQAKKKTPKKKKTKTINYSSIKEFLYDKMLLTGGFVDRSYEFDEDDIKTLRLLCTRELKKKGSKK
jgi:hypothetical protein